MSTNFFQSIIKKLFRPDSSGQRSAPFVTERLVRNGGYAERYRAWKVSGRYAQDLALIDQVWTDVNENGRRKEMDLFRYTSQKSNGFFFNPNIGLVGAHFTFLLDYFKEVVIENGYTLYMSDRRYNEKGDKVECAERHYLKPDIRVQTTSPLPQLFGNIVIENILVDGKPAYLKLMANVYSDRNYAQPKPFADLMSKLLAQPN